jgi:hypothetical protein
VALGSPTKAGRHQSSTAQGEVALDGGRAGRRAVERHFSSARERAVAVVPDAVWKIYADFNGSL